MGVGHFGALLEKRCVFEQGRSTAGARIGLLLHPNVTATLEDRVATLSSGDARAIVRCSKPIALEDAVWWPDMGRELPTRRLVVWYEPGDTEVETRLEIQ